MRVVGCFCYCLDVFCVANNKSLDCMSNTVSTLFTKNTLKPNMTTQNTKSIRNQNQACSFSYPMILFSTKYRTMWTGLVLLYFGWYRFAFLGKCTIGCGLECGFMGDRSNCCASMTLSKAFSEGVKNGLKVRAMYFGLLPRPFIFSEFFFF